MQLTQGKLTTYDDEDHELISAHNWYAIKGHRTFYAMSAIRIEGKRIWFAMHRKILGLTDGRLYVDHIDGDGLNNQRSNLRICTSDQNTKNQRLRITNKSGYKGVCWDKRNKKWFASITHNRKQFNLGYFDDPKSAHEAYCAAAIRLHGEFCNLG